MAAWSVGPREFSDTVNKDVKIRDQEQRQKKVLQTRSSFVLEIYLPVVMQSLLEPIFVTINCYYRPGFDSSSAMG